MILCAGATDPGCVRPDNEDRYFIDEGLSLFIIADGMGGHRHGALAAEIAISTMRFYIESSLRRNDVTWPFGYNFNISMNLNRLNTSIKLANRQVWRQAEQGPEFAGMGTTIAALMVEGGLASVANVGDSRLYLLRERRLTQLTTDDTWLNAVLRNNVKDLTALQNHPMRDVLTQAAGSQTDVDVHTSEFELADGDMLLLSTDGLHEVVPEPQLIEILADSLQPEKSVADLITAARCAGAPDNAACVLVLYTKD